MLRTIAAQRDVDAMTIADRSYELERARVVCQKFRDDHVDPLNIGAGKVGELSAGGVPLRLRRCRGSRYDDADAGP